jgi:hypothetical protein
VQENRTESRVSISKQHNISRSTFATACLGQMILQTGGVSLPYKNATPTYSHKLIEYVFLPQPTAVRQHEISLPFNGDPCTCSKSTDSCRHNITRKNYYSVVQIKPNNSYKAEATPRGCMIYPPRSVTRDMVMLRPKPNCETISNCMRLTHNYLIHRLCPPPPPRSLRKHRGVSEKENIWGPHCINSKSRHRSMLLANMSGRAVGAITFRGEEQSFRRC